MKSIKILITCIILVFSTNIVSANSNSSSETIVKVEETKNAMEYSAYENGKLVSSLTLTKKSDGLEVKTHFPDSKGCTMNYYQKDKLVKSVQGSSVDEDWIWVVILCLHGEATYNSNGWGITIAFDCLQFADNIEILPVY